MKEVNLEISGTLSIHRSTWVNTLVGLIDSSFLLTEPELFFCTEAIVQLLNQLQIPQRSTPLALPSALVLELEASMFSNQIHGPRDAGVQRVSREATAGDVVVSLQVWRQTLLNNLTTAYPDLNPFERMMAAKVFDDLLSGIGVPDRVAQYLPDDVVRAHLNNG